MARMVSVKPIVVSAALACLCSARSAHGQPSSIAADGSAGATAIAGVPKIRKKTSTIRGRLRAAEAGSAVVGGLITIDTASGAHFEVHPSASGEFVVTHVPAEKCTIVASGDGFLSQSRTLTLIPDVNETIDFSLVPMEAEELLDVSAKRNLVHPQVASNTTFINKDVIDKYKTGNSLRDVIETAPGISQDSFGNVVVRGEHNTVNYTLDGVVLPEAVGQFQQGQVASPHSLQEVEVTTGGYQASAGGGPMGAIVNMKSMPIRTRPFLELTPQIGGPTQGGLSFYASSAVSQDVNSKWNRVRFESSGTIFGTKLGLSPPSRHFTRDGRFDLNCLNRVDWDVTERDRLRLTAAINESYMHIPTLGISRQFGFKEQEHDRQNYIILSYRHLFKRFFDEANLHLLNGFYSQRLGSTNAFDPAPIINGAANSITAAAPTGKRFNYVFSAQGDLRKSVSRTHHLQAGFLSEVRPVRTYFSAFYYDANPADANYGQLISPFTNDVQGPQLQGNTGKYRGFRFLQSAYLQDTWTPERGFLRRFTVDSGVRFDLFHGVFGNTMGIANQIAAYNFANFVPPDPTAAPTFNTNAFVLKPFQTNRVTNAQVSPRFAVAYRLSRSIVLRGSFAQVFTAPPVDLIPRPFDITQGTINGIFNGSLRPMQATRGQIVDSSIEKQIGSRFALKADMYYKYLHNVGDELPVNNTVLYQRLTLAALESEGVEARIDMKPGRDGTGIYGFVSNTVMVARLGGNHKDSGGIYDIDPTPATAKYIDHDRRETLTAALGYRGKSFWVLCNFNFWTGFLNGLDPATFGPHPARTRPLALVGLNLGYITAPKLREAHKMLPTGVDVRIQNIANNVVPINLGSPFQGTRYTLPIQVLVQTHWSI